MNNVWDRSVFAFAVTVLVFLVGLAAADNARAQSAQDFVGAVGAMALAPHMDVSDQTISDFQNYRFEVSEGGTQVEYPGDAEDCRWAATIVVAFAASRSRSIDSTVYCNRHYVTVDVDISYADNLEGFAIVERRRSDDEVVWSKRR